MEATEVTPAMLTLGAKLTVVALYSLWQSMLNGTTFVDRLRSRCSDFHSVNGSVQPSAVTIGHL